MTIEDHFLFYKFAREGLKAEQVASPAVFSPAAKLQRIAQEHGISADFGFELKQLAEAAVFCVIGIDLPMTHPILWLELVKARRRGAKIVNLSSRKPSFDRFADLPLSLRRGGELFLFGAVTKSILELVSAAETAGPKELAMLRNSLEDIDDASVQKKTGVAEDDLGRLVRIFLAHAPALFLFGQELGDQPWGEKNIAALWNLAHLVGGRLIPLSPEANSSSASLVHRHFETPDRSIDQVLESVSSGRVKFLYLAGISPHLEAKPSFLIVQDAFEGENVRLADVVFPAATFLETEGHIGNVEGRMQRFKRVMDPPGEARPDGWIIARLAKRLKLRGFEHENASDVMAEVRNRLPALVGAENGKQKKRKAGTTQVETRGPDHFIPVEYGRPPLKSNPDYPLWLVPEWNADSYRSFDLSREIKGLRLLRDSRRVLIHPEDAQALDLQEGDPVTVTSGQGAIPGTLRVTDSLRKGSIAMRLGWNNSPKGFRTPKIRPVRVERENR